MLEIDAKYTNENRKYQRVDASKPNALLEEKVNAKNPQSRVCDLNRSISEGYVRWSAQKRRIPSDNPRRRH